MTKLTMRTLIVAAMLATPACAADVDAPGNSPPQPTPAVSQTAQDQTILADALAEVTAQYQTMLAEQAARAARADTTYRTTVTSVLVIVSLMGIAVTVAIFVVEKVSLSRRKDEIGKLGMQVQELQAEAKTLTGAAASATKGLRHEVSVLYGHIAYNYLRHPEPRPDVGFLMVANATHAADVAGESADKVVQALLWWNGIAQKGGFAPMTNTVVDGALAAAWQAIMKVETRRKEPTFMAAAGTMRQFVTDLLGADSLQKVLAGQKGVMAQPESPKPTPAKPRETEAE